MEKIVFMYGIENITREQYLYRLAKYLRIFSVNIAKCNAFKIQA